VRVQSFSSFARVVSTAVLLALTVPPAGGDVGGGKGYPATPWRKAGPKSVAELEKAQAAAAQVQTLTVPGELVLDKWDGPIELNRVSLRMSPAREADKPGYELSGTSPLGKPLVVSFSRIERFTVIARNGTVVTLAVMIWPDISAADLLEKQPTYKELAAGYRREVTIELSIAAADGRGLIFSDGDRTLPFSKLTVGTKGDFYGGHPHAAHPMRFWWAIPSVANDPDYPFRLIPAASRAPVPLPELALQSERGK
jgi:hypothetical protein